MKTYALGSISILILSVLLPACASALSSAAGDGDVEKVKTLLDQGADVNLWEPGTALMAASLEGHVEVVKLLIDRGAKVNLGNKAGFCPLSNAARKGHEDVASILIAHGADIDLAIEGLQTQLDDYQSDPSFLSGEIQECKSGIRMLTRLAKQQAQVAREERPKPVKRPKPKPALVSTPSPTPVPAPKPVVAVFDIEVKGLELDAGALDRLADWLGTLLTRRDYQVVPRSQLKERLLQQKTESYKSCYDESCQIEIGKELAAEKTLSTQVLKLGGVCKVSLTLFDLKRAASERAGQGEGACDEEGVVRALEAAVDDLARAK